MPSNASTSSFGWPTPECELERRGTFGFVMSRYISRQLQTAPSVPTASSRIYVGNGEPANAAHGTTLSALFRGSSYGGTSLTLRVLLHFFSWPITGTCSTLYWIRLALSTRIRSRSAVVTS